MRCKQTIKIGTMTGIEAREEYKKRKEKTEENRTECKTAEAMASVKQ